VLHRPFVVVGLAAAIAVAVVAPSTPPGQANLTEIGNPHVPFIDLPLAS
jgi:hypothetical protein